MDNQRAIELLHVHIDTEDMPLFSQAAAIGIRAIRRVEALERELAEAREELARQIACREDSDRKLMAADDALNASACELAEALEDGERLDWLTQQMPLTLLRCEGVVWAGDQRATGPTLRAAIDAARAQEGKG